MKPNLIAPTFLAFLLLNGCASTAKPPAAQQAAAPTPAAATPTNDFPTLTRVEYVLSCMKEKGGNNYDNMYHCVCAVDRIAANMSHEDFLQAETFETNKSLGGERGGAFRDPLQVPALGDKVKKLKAVLDDANTTCFPNGGKTSASKPK
jgi:PBP1b-binding outer membrane lipoprotein LpoB